MVLPRYCPREGYVLHPNARLLLTKQDLKVAVPVRGTGCIPRAQVERPEGALVAVPVRGTGCICVRYMRATARDRNVAVPVRGAG